MDPQSMVERFHRLFDIAGSADAGPGPDERTRVLRERLIQEEFEELKEAMGKRIWRPLRRNWPICCTWSTGRLCRMGSTWTRCSAKCIGPI